MESLEEIFGKERLNKAILKNQIHIIKEWYKRQDELKNERFEIQ